jgi:hypothetical protein
LLEHHILLSASPMTKTIWKSQMIIIAFWLVLFSFFFFMW